MSSRLPAAERHRQLLDVALVEFARNGFPGTSMNRIADAAGVTKPVLYQHFESKRALFAAVLTDVGERLAAEIVEATAHATTPRGQVAGGFTAYFSFMARNRDAFFVLFGAGTFRDDEFAVVVARFESDMADTIADLIVIEGLSPEHRRLLAQGIVGIAEVTSRNWLRSTDAPLDPPPEALAAQVATLAWSGLRGIAPV
ncbi:MAG TPA: TetR/AcrR family transcriptional regulator [Acidimicrobiales bacterium]|nr:TetR/AcrR family transcriptional regulator [Acidimicrobiales bacterium]